MNENEKTQIVSFNEELPGEIRLRLVRTLDERSNQFAAFCRELQQLAPKIHVVQEKDESHNPPEIRIHSRIRYQALPLGAKLAPFLDGLLLLSDGKVPHIHPAVKPLLDEIAIPSDLSLYIAGQCPFCPGAVKSLLPLAAANPWIQLTVVDSELFMEKALKDGVKAVPTLILDRHLRWTGTFNLKEIVSSMIHRDPSKLEADSLINMIENGNAGLLAKMMLEKNMIFPALADLAVHPKWPVRLGAMVTLETIADEKPVLAQKMVPVLWDRFDSADNKAKGDILYIVGEIDDGSSSGRIADVLNGDYDSEIMEAAEEALEKQNNKSVVEIHCPSSEQNK